jgi:hypothetical protein
MHRRSSLAPALQSANGTWHSPITLTEPVNLTIQSGLKLANPAKTLAIQGGTQVVMVGGWKASLPIIRIEVRNVKSN